MSSHNYNVLIKLNDINLCVDVDVVLNVHVYLSAACAKHLSQTPAF